jgi:hypothetical protein
VQPDWQADRAGERAVLLSGAWTLHALGPRMAALGVGLGDLARDASPGWDLRRCSRIWAGAPS